MMRKNILFITADQWRGDCLSALNHPHVKTPNINALIDDGIAFKQHHTVCVPCAPARASLLTGMYLQNHRVTRNGTPLADRHTNIARELRKAGYAPKLFGYTDTTLDPHAFTEDEVRKHGYEGKMSGFEEGLLLLDDQEPWLQWLKKNGYNFRTSKEAFHTGFDSNNNPKRPRAAYPTAYKAEHSPTAFLTESVLNYIDQHIKDDASSWFVHLSYLRPHPPFVAPEPYNKIVDPNLLEPIDKAGEQAKDHPYLKAARSPFGDWPEPWIQTLADQDDYESEAQQIRATYYGLIQKVDHYIGQVIEHLKEIGEYDNTLIVLTSDHGELMGDHGLFGKRGYFRESYHIPLIIRDPNQPLKERGHIEKSITESIDIMPTILDWIDHPIPRQCDGYSLLPFIHKEKPKEWRKEAHWEYDFHNVRSPDLEKSLGLEMDECKLNVIWNDKYMYVFFVSLPALLFDLHKDPKASNNIANNPKYMPIILELSQKLLSWRMKQDERILTAYSISKDDIFCRDR